MAAIQLEHTAHYVKHESFQVKTADNEDHTFCGIMFDLEVKHNRPVDFIELESLWVRGHLGPITVWAVRDGHEGKHEDQSLWTQVYEANHHASPRQLVELKLPVPLCCKPGEKFGLYVHSRRTDDMAIVYDNQRDTTTHEDSFIRILPGYAHLSPVPFSSWEGAWWGCWRERRCFVGKANFGVRYLLWTPQNIVHDKFPQRFRSAASTLFRVHAFSWTGLPAVIVLYILNMCPWDWFGDEDERPRTLAGRVRDGVGSMMPWHRIRGRLMRAAHDLPGLPAQVLEHLMDAHGFDYHDDIEDDDEDTIEYVYFGENDDDEDYEPSHMEDAGMEADDIDDTMEGDADDDDDNEEEAEDGGDGRDGDGQEESKTCIVVR